MAMAADPERSLATIEWPRGPLGFGASLEGVPNRQFTVVAACEVADGVPDTVASLAATLAALPPSMHSSLQADLAAGKPSELDTIGGELLRTGQRYNLTLPAIETIMSGLNRDASEQSRTRGLGREHLDR